MAAMNGVKVEDDMKIKPDPEDEAEGGFADDDEYEDTGELTMPREEQEIWLAKVPKWMWEALSEANDSEEPLHIGQLNTYEDLSLKPAEREREKTHRFVFNKDFKRASKIPKEYELEFTKADPPNMHIFSEKDLPGYKANPFSRSNKQDYNAGKAQGVQKGRRYRKAIPKQTALLRSIRKELSCTPVDNKEYHEFMEKRKKQVEKSQITLESGGDYLPTNADMNFGTLIRGTTKKKSGQDNKAARIPEVELVPMLFDAFKQYKYWSLKTLRTRTRQPEQYLKQVLSGIAELVTSGPFNGNWTLKKESYIDFDDANVEEIAPEAGDPSSPEDVDDLEDDEDEEMEDVV
ncbi:hypothetical protein EJ05DRAFT_479682 [Pseudovirgaria hyperparasitica]|uniref:Transcription initiation factor IIF subunit beta n=1 Tax=Pseudovirgaria hyperparasitica TaxID=470096 RepID=A0A6A6VWP3_9PEZI|nr:uncharacterized protein EJ05DRAFT_479682 [Pseudovirgaria hyperparasitica]KAF2754134.1 hypothetical protein EJ05DRAFT_479682 [Pseudovirgaria hyperparasitica]